MKIILKLSFVLLSSLFFNAKVFSQNKQEQKSKEIHWVSIEEAEKLNKKEPRKIFIDLYTNWCGWCKRMDATTFQDPFIVNYLNNKYYAVKFNAETRDTINFNGKTFIFKPELRANEFAYTVMQGQIKGYPTSVYLDEHFTVLTSVASFLTAEQIEPLLKYFGEGDYKKMNWDNYQQNFKGEVH